MAAAMGSCTITSMRPNKVFEAYTSSSSSSSSSRLMHFAGLRRPMQAFTTPAVPPRSSSSSSSFPASAPSLKYCRKKIRAHVASSAPKRERDPKKRIVITGMGLVSVFGNDIDAFYDKLLQGQSGISLIDRFDASSFSVKFGGQIRDFSSQGYIDGKNDRSLDNCWRYCLVAGKRALEDANLGSEVPDYEAFFLVQC